MKNLAVGIAQAEEMYYLANGNYTADLAQLSIELSGGTLNQYQYTFPWGRCFVQVSGQQDVFCENNDIKMAFQIFFDHSTSNPGKRSCFTHNNRISSSVQHGICKSETRNNGFNSGSVDRAWWY